GDAGEQAVERQFDPALSRPVVGTADEHTNAVCRWVDTLAHRRCIDTVASEQGASRLDRVASGEWHPPTRRVHRAGYEPCRHACIAECATHVFAVAQLVRCDLQPDGLPAQGQGSAGGVHYGTARRGESLNSNLLALSSS